MSQEPPIEMAETNDQTAPGAEDKLLTEQQPNGSDKGHDIPKSLEIMKNIIIISSFFVAMFGVGLNYGIWWTLDDLKSFYDDYNFCQDGKDIRWMVYINITITFFMGLVTTKFTDIETKRYHYLVCIGGVISMSGLFSSRYAGNVTVLYVTFGFITGVGFGLMLPPSWGLILKYFNTTVWGAVAFMVASICLLFVPPLFEYVKELYGKRSVFVILACLYGQLTCILLFLSLLFLIFTKFPQRPSKGNNVKCLKFNFNLLIKPLIFNMVIAALLIGMGQNIMVLHLKQIAMQKGAGERDLQLSPIYYGSAMIFGLLCYVIFPPRCKQREEDNIIDLWKFGVSLVAAGAAVIGSVQSDSFGAFIGINIVSAAGSGFYLPLMFVLLKAFCKEQDRENGRQTAIEIEALRFVLTAFGIGALIGLPIGDVLNTTFGDGSSYYLAGVALILTCPWVLVRGNLIWCKRGSGTGTG